MTSKTRGFKPGSKPHSIQNARFSLQSSELAPLPSHQQASVAPLTFGSGGGGGGGPKPRGGGGAKTEKETEKFGLKNEKIQSI